MTDPLRSTPGNAPLRVGIAQLKPTKADPEENLRRIGEAIVGAGDVDVLVFPETILSGYHVEGGVEEVARSVDEVLDGLGGPPESGGPDIVLGTYERGDGAVYNSAIYAAPVGEGYEAVHVHRKVFLPTYGLFDEARFVRPGPGFRAFGTRFGSAGLLVCEDLWHSPTVAALALGGARVVYVLSASPIREIAGDARRARTLERWERLARTAAAEHGIFVVLAQLVGSEGGKLFPGGSVVVGPGGEVLARAPLYEEGVTRVALDGDAVFRARVRSSLLADLEVMLPRVIDSLEAAVGRGRGRARATPSGAAAPASHPDAGPSRTGPSEPAGGLGASGRLTGGDPDALPAGSPDPEDRSILAIDPAGVEAALVEFIRDEVRRRRGFERVVVGVSGGVDSAVVLLLAARALGADAVDGLRLPYAVTSEESMEHARRVMELAGVGGETVAIDGAVDGYAAALGEEITPARRANVQSRIRAVALYDHAARLGALPLGATNKSERLLGYYTWHGDDAPPIHPIGDLFKVQVRALARHLGVPDEIVDKPATPELIEGVTDEEELGVEYADADAILHWLLSGWRPGELVRCGFEEADVRRIAELLDGTHWKRELPAVAVLSPTTPGEFYLRPADY